MRSAAVALLLTGPAGLWAQAPSVFESIKPQATVLIRRHESGADLAEVSILDPGYPRDLLQRQIEGLCREVGSDARGLQIYEAALRSEPPRLSVLKATFGTVGLIDHQSGDLRLTPVIRCLLGAPPPYAIRDLGLIYDSEAPTPTTLRSFSSSTVSLEARYNPPPIAGLEYRIRVLSQTPADIDVPDRYLATVAEASPVMPDRIEPKARPWWLVWTLVSVVGLSGVALVYLALLLRTGRAQVGP
ncbi:MAG: hypothetical protein HYR64_09245 [Fimbriimonas ginsengisoli]|uniref:Uncharacterized protein n=1 Tax=Fimbriimonas ginsengisoli TaxID=1005039 RepID=A0A931PWF7_FIMGI|nr:hypothetical protein [Fimbriimonas ginsengisoli]